MPTKPNATVPERKQALRHDVVELLSAMREIVAVCNVCNTKDLREQALNTIRNVAVRAIAEAEKIRPLQADPSLLSHWRSKERG